MKITQEQAFEMLAARLMHAREKHPVFADDAFHAIDVIFDEVEELQVAVAIEGPQRVIDEALDVAATAMRLVMGEVQG